MITPRSLKRWQLKLLDSYEWTADPHAQVKGFRELPKAIRYLIKWIQELKKSIDILVHNITDNSPIRDKNSSAFD